MFIQHFALLIGDGSFSAIVLATRTAFIYQSFEKRVFPPEQAITFFDAKLQEILFHFLQRNSLLLLSMEKIPQIKHGMIVEE